MSKRAKFSNEDFDGLVVLFFAGILTMHSRLLLLHLMLSAVSLLSLELWPKNRCYLLKWHSGSSSSGRGRRKERRRKFESWVESLLFRYFCNNHAASFEIVCMKWRRSREWFSPKNAPLLISRHIKKLRLPPPLLLNFFLKFCQRTPEILT